MQGNVAGEFGRQGHFASLRTGLPVILEEGLAAQHGAAQGFEQAAGGLGLDLDPLRETDHRAGFGANAFIGGQFGDNQGIGWTVQDFDFHKMLLWSFDL